MRFRLPIICALLLAILVPLGDAYALDLERRRMLTSAEHKPWRAVGRVNVANFGARGMCTGTLIDEDLVLTAAHCVIDEMTGKPFHPDSVHFVAGWRRGQKVAHSKAETIIVHPGYHHGRQLTYKQIGSDLALIRLRDRIPNEKAPFFQVAAAPGPTSPLTLISYRRDRAHALTRQDGCTLIGQRGAVLALACDVTFGASGSPIFAEIDGKYRVIGVVSAKGEDRGQARAFAVRVDAAIGDVLAALN
ncbi:MAG: trypsin-like serine protease [Pseudomonadota bacterium]